MGSAADPASRREFRTGVRVRYGETDRMGVAYHAHYFVWFEIGRTELMRALGCPYGRLEDDEGLLFPVVESGARHLAPARYDDELLVRTWIARIGGASLRFEYELRHGVRDTLLATGFTVHAAVGRAGRPVRMPDAVRRRLLDMEPR